MGQWAVMGASHFVEFIAVLLFSALDDPVLTHGYYIVR